MRYLFLDTETGGLPDNTSLLSLAMLVTDGYLDEVDHVEWKLKSNDGIYTITAGGLSVNKIDIVKHDKKAQTYRDVKDSLSMFLHKHWSENNCKPLVPVGKNVAFDVRRLWGAVISRGRWGQFVSYQPLDINGAWRLCELKGKVPALPKTSLSDLANYFRIPVVDLHTAQGDNLIALEVMRRIVQL